MKAKFLLFSTLVIFVFAMIWNGLVHMVILKEANQQIAEILRQDSDGKMWFSIVLTLAISFLFSLGYMKWAKTTTQSETLTFSIYFAVLMGTVINLNQYIVYPIPFRLTATWFLFGIAEFLIYGQIARLIRIKTLK